jgi:hypothetical protein
VGSTYRTVHHVYGRSSQVTVWHQLLSKWVNNHVILLNVSVSKMSGLGSTFGLCDICGDQRSMINYISHKALHSFLPT